MLSSSSGRPSRMSQLMSIPAPSLMSQLIQSSGGSVPEPQLSRRRACSAMDADRPELLDQTGKHPPGAEVLLGYLPRRTGVAGGHEPHLFDRADRLLQVGEGQQALPRRQVVAEAGLLRDHRLAAGQVAGAAIA